MQINFQFQIAGITYLGEGQLKQLVMRIVSYKLGKSSLLTKYVSTMLKADHYRKKVHSALELFSIAKFICLTIVNELEISINNKILFQNLTYSQRIPS